jgi:uncharacterized phosphosugar-binding protein
MSMERYFGLVNEVLRQVEASEPESIRAAAALCARAIAADRLIHTFGTGHSSLLAAEGLYRAGGLACVDAMLESPVTFEPGAVASSLFERTSGYAPLLLERYHVAEGDVLVVFSNSGVNALPVEVAVGARARGVHVVGVVSRAYASQAPRSASGGESLAEVADVVIDNHVPPGDAVVAFYDESVRAASVSTVSGAFIWNALVAEVVSSLEKEAIRAPIYVSSNMPRSKDTNEALVRRFRTRVRHL